MAYKSRFETKEINRLFEAVLTLENIEDCYRFFEDLCTINEINSMAQRLEVATMLSNKNTYNEIEKATGASTATISRINKCLYYGSDGYQKVIEILKNK